MRNTQKHTWTVQKQKSLLIEMVRTDFKLRYQASALGYVWSLLKPLFLFGILYTVFSKFLKLGADVPNYALSLLLGIVLWSFFADATSGSLKSIVAKGGLIRKIDIPRILIPVAATASAFINMLLSLSVVFVFVLFSKDTALSLSTLIWLPLYLLQLAVFTLGVGLLLATMFVKLRDVNYIWDVVRQALFYSIPIIYPLTRITSQGIKQALMINPLAQIIQGARSVMTHGDTQTISKVYDNQLVVLIPLAITVIVFVLGVWYFVSNSKKFAENI